IDEGKKQFKQECYPEALEAFECAIEVDPNSASAYYFRGLVLEAMGQLHEALLSYETAMPATACSPRSCQRSHCDRLQTLCPSRNSEFRDGHSGHRLDLR
ncbi:MAG: tetratricopeptide repeat protein, partial [Ktedonobacteraceae bacterium]